MAITLKKHQDDETLLLAHTEANSTWHQFSQHILAIDEALKNTTQRCDLITTSDTDLPRGNPLPYLRRLFDTFDKHQHFHTHVVVSSVSIPLAEVFTKTLLRVFKRRHKFHIADSYEEALAIIEESRNYASN